MKKGFIAFTMATMLSLFAAGAFAADTLTIGALYPISGSLALLGEESFRGAELARVKRNEAGGVAGMQIQFEQGDAATVQAARSEAERLIEQKNAPLLIGTFSSSRCMAATEVAARKRIPYFELGAIANPITGRGYKTVWRTNPTALDFSRSQVDFIESWLAPKLGKKPVDVKIAIAHEDSDYGTSVAESFRELAKESGMEVVSVQPYAATSSDLSSVIFRLKKADADIVVAVSYAQDAILLSRQAYELKLKTPLMGTGGGHSLQSFADALGEHANGVFNVDFTQYEVNRSFTPGLGEFLERYKNTYQSPPRSGHSLTNYMGITVLFDILEKTGGKTDVQSIQKAAAAVDISPGTTATGWGVKFNEKGQNTRAVPLVTQWREGKLVTVWPQGAAVMKPILK